MRPDAPNTVAVVVLLVGLSPWFFVARRRPALALAGLVGVAAFSSHVFAGLYALGVPASAVRAMIGTKDYLALLTLLGQLSTRRPPRRLLWAGVGLLAVLIGALSHLGDGVSAYDFGVSLRDLLLGPAAVVSGLLLTPAQRVQLLGKVAWIIGAGAVYALVELLLPVTFLTRVLEIGPYWRDVKQQPQFLVDLPGRGLLPGNFYNDPYELGGTRRLSGAFGDPLSAGVLLAFGLAATASVLRRWQAAALGTVTTFALALTVTRAGWLLAAATLAPAVVAATASRATWARARLLGSAVLLLVALGAVIGPVRSYVVKVVSGDNSSTQGHLNAIRSLTDFPYSLSGTGIGAFGATSGRGTESVWATVLVQLGFVLGTLFLASVLYGLVQARRSWQPTGSYVGFVIALLVTWTISEQWLSFNAGWSAGLWAGVGVVLTRSLPDRLPRPTGAQLRAVVTDKRVLAGTVTLALVVTAAFVVPAQRRRARAEARQPIATATGRGTLGRGADRYTPFAVTPLVVRAGQQVQVSVVVRQGFGQVLGLYVHAAATDVVVTEVTGSTSVQFTAPVDFTQVLLKPVVRATTGAISTSLLAVSYRPGHPTPALVVLRDAGPVLPAFTRFDVIKARWSRGQRVTVSVDVLGDGGVPVFGVYAVGRQDRDEAIGFTHGSFSATVRMPFDTVALVLKPTTAQTTGSPLDVQLQASAPPSE